MYTEYSQVLLGKLREIQKERLKRHVLARIQELLPAAELNADAINRIAVFPRSKIIFNRIKKNASNTVMVGLYAIEHGQILDVEELKAKRQKFSEIARCFRAVNNIEEYDLLLITRNPYSRVLSAFLDLFRQDKYRSEFGPFELSPNGFYEFLLWLKDGGLTRNWHWNKQKELMLLPRSSYNTVIKFEEFPNSFAEYLGRYAGAFTEGDIVKLLVKGTRHATKADQLAESFYDRKATKLASELYDDDFRLLGYAIED